MSYIDENLGDGEQAVFRTKLHAAVIVFPMVILALAVLYFGKYNIGFYGIGWGVSLILAVWLAVELANHGVSEFGVTNQRLRMKQGYLPRRVLDTPLAQVEGMQVTQSALGQRLGYGTVVVRGTDGRRTAFASLNHPVEFRDRVQEQMGRVKPAGTRPAK
jgi:uncharacterized membrane protein YdbT with pleckstrin-like domain